MSMLPKLKSYDFWFVTGSQHLYGPETLEQVAAHSEEITRELSECASIPCRLIFKPVVKTASEISEVCEAANADIQCAGIITWMHTFSPAKMWIAGLSVLRKPLLHLHTQYNRDIPWSSIDMDFMNLNQAAHGDREYGYIGTRMKIDRKVVVGYWKDERVTGKIGSWMRSAVGCLESRRLKVARFGDNMRNVAVTEGDKVEAQIKLGWTVDGYGVGELVSRVAAVTKEQVDNLMEEYEETYTFCDAAKTAGPARDAVRVQSRYEIAMKAFLEEGGYGAFTTTFEDLFGLDQLPGLAVQRLMAAGYGFGGEGDWKTAAMVRLIKLMGGPSGRGSSFMEDYTYHMEPGNELVLGAHMLEVCPTIAKGRPHIEVHPLGIGGKNDPARIVFEGGHGAAINASLVDMGDRFRLIVNEVEAVLMIPEMPMLPVARVLWKPSPNLMEAAEQWILAGGAHHTVFSFDIDSEQMRDWAQMLGIEYILIK